MAIVIPMGRNPWEGLTAEETERRKAKLRASAKAQWTPERKAEARAKASARWTPEAKAEAKAEASARATARWTPEARQKASEAGAARWTPELREQSSKAHKARWTPELREQARVKALAAWTPEKRAEARKRAMAQPHVRNSPTARLDYGDTQKPPGRLTLYARVSRPEISPSLAMWLAKCACGHWTAVRADRFVSENTRSCGCLAVAAAERNVARMIGRRQAAEARANERHTMMAVYAAKMGFQ